MFDVKAKDANITITAMTISVFSGTSAQVWSKSGSYIGSEYSSVGWTKVGGKNATAYVGIAMYGSNCCIS